MNNFNISFALGFIIGSIFNLFVIWWFHNKIYLPQNHDTSNKKLLKEIEEKLCQLNPQEKENKNVVDPNQEKEENNHFALIHHDQQTS